MKKVLNNTQLSDFCRQTAMLLESGLTLYDGMLVLSEDSDDSESKNLYNNIVSSLDSGKSFRDSLKGTETFPPYMTEMTSVGEISGNLYKTMSSLADYYENQQSVHENINTAIKYPCAMVIMMLTVIAVLTAKVLPVFSQVYSQLGLQATALSQTVMNTSSVMTKVIIAVIILFSAVCLFTVLLSKSDSGKEKLTQFLQKFPFTASVYSYFALADFAGCMNTMLSSGLDIFTAVDKSESVLNQNSIKEKIKAIKNKMSEGNSFEYAVSDSDIFTHTEGKMLTIAGKSGNTDSILAKLSKDYTEKAYREINRKISVIEPCIVTGFSLLTGAILLSVVLPLMGVISGML